MHAFKWSFAFGLLTALTSAPAMADGASETVTAQMHADLAAHAADLSGVQTHLHHVLNCLVGPGGAGFDAKQMNPCANAGNGAIPDTSATAKKQILNEAADKARTGIAATDLATAQKTAVQIATMLKGK